MIKPEVIYQDDNFLVVNKPAGLLVHPTGKGEDSLVDWLIEHYPGVRQVGDDPEERPGIVHRLDKDTSGVLLICLNQKTFDYFKKLFQERKIKKTYLALVYGAPKENEGEINKPLGIKSGSTKRTARIDKARMVKEAVTKYKVVKKFDDFSLLEVMPLTGRTHQIRAHLSSISHPIVGDKLYGPKKNSGVRMFLHAESLEFTASTGEKIQVSAELPEDLKSFLDSIR